MVISGKAQLEMFEQPVIRVRSVIRRKALAGVQASLLQISLHTMCMLLFK